MSNNIKYKGNDVTGAAASVNTNDLHQKQINSKYHSSSISSIIEDALRSKQISVDDEKKKGSLIIVDAVRAYQIDTNGAMNFAKDLAVRAARDGKEGVFNLSDMGSFFLFERIDRLIEYEQNVPKKMDFKFKAICSYHRDNFGILAEEQQRTLLSGHNTVIGVRNEP